VRVEFRLAQYRDLIMGMHHFVSLPDCLNYYQLIKECSTSGTVAISTQISSLLRTVANLFSFMTDYFVVRHSKSSIKWGYHCVFCRCFKNVP
jgi:hypothetical protein